jgi:tRNA A-37 threonylcarbamoyl transferase component Bud32
MRTPEQGVVQEEINFEEEFFKFLEKVDEETKKTVGYKSIVEEAEDSGDYKISLEKLKKFFAKRNETLDKASIKIREGFRISSEEFQREMDNIKITMSDQERMLGNGAVAEVYYMRGIVGGDSCVKVVHDEARYAEGIPLDKEAEVLEILRNVEVKGVRTPRPFYTFSSHRMKGMVMEELDAFNFRRVLEGKVTRGMKDVFPENFDLDDYFERLKEYFKHLHSLGVYHGDIALRNLMIDRKTALPAVIDFGKARLQAEIDKTNLNLPDYAGSDMAALESAKIQAKKEIEELKMAKLGQTIDKS